MDATVNYWGHPTGPHHPANNSAGEGERVSDGVIFTPWREEPRCWAVILRAHPQLVLENEPVTLLGHGISHTGDIVEYHWSSSLDGELYSGSDPGPMSILLSNGTHAISLRVRDSLGHLSDPAGIKVVVNGIPRVSLAGLEAWIMEGESILLSGEASDDGTIMRYVWSTDREGVLYSGPNPTYFWRWLSQGDRVLSFYVMDDLGARSGTASMNFSVYARPVPAIESVTSTMAPPGTLISDVPIRFMGSGRAVNPIVRYVWVSDVSGVLYNGTDDSFVIPGLPNGTHTISLRVMDGMGIWSGNVTRVIHVDLRPEAVIRSFSPNPGILGETISFQGAGVDDGVILQYAWSSSLDGGLANGSTAGFSTSRLSYGVHTITLRVKDDAHIWSHPVNATLVISVRPVARIHAVSPNPANPGEAVTFTGDISHDHTISLLRWTSSIDGILITTPNASVSIPDLTPGVHIISLTVMNEDGVWSGPASSALEILGRSSPVLVLVSPEQGTVVEGMVNITLTATGAHNATRLEYRLQGGTGWKSVPGSNGSWVLSWDSRQVANGTHLLVFRAFDGFVYSAEVTLELEVRNPPPPPLDFPDREDETNYLLFMAFVGLILMVLLALALYLQRQVLPGPREETGLHERPGPSSPSPLTPPRPEEERDSGGEGGSLPGSDDSADPLASPTPPSPLLSSAPPHLPVPPPSPPPPEDDTPAPESFRPPTEPTSEHTGERVEELPDDGPSLSSPPPSSPPVTPPAPKSP